MINNDRIPGATPLEGKICEQIRDFRIHVAHAQKSTKAQSYVHASLLHCRQKVADAVKSHASETRMYLISKSRCENTATGD